MTMAMRLIVGSILILTVGVVALNTKTRVPSTWPTLTFVGGARDSQPPWATILSLTSTSLDATNNPVDLELNITVGDDLSGVGTVHIQFVPPVGTNDIDLYLTPDDQYSGNGTFGLWGGIVSLPRGTASGAWLLNFVNVTDNAGNNKLYKTGAFPSGFTLDFTIQSVTDTIPPQCSNYQLSPGSVNTPKGEILWFTATCSDVGSGVSDVWPYRIWTADQTDSLTISEGYRYAVNMVSYLSNGTIYNGTWTIGIVLPNYLPGNPWTVAEVWAYDNVANQLDDTTPSSNAVTLTTLPAHPETPPTIISVTASPTTIDLTATYETVVTFTIVLADNQTSFTSGAINYYNAATNSYFGLPLRSYGSSADGQTTTWIARFAFFNHQITAGTWTISSAYFVDFWDNQATFVTSSSTQLRASSPLTITALITTIIAIIRAF
jgi:hypothetical protein